MKRLSLKLSREALLFDSPLYILKGFLSMVTAYMLFSSHPIVGKDMISVFFGMMMTLEPLNVSGLKTGWSQVQATILGGVVTAVICYFFGVNWLTISLSVALTMYISLLLNWRMVSPVAIFTAIYMTQYIQLNAVGEVSMVLTLRLRMVALAAGILVAVFYNYVFSLFFYKKMLKKRIVYSIEGFEKVLGQTHLSIEEQLHQTNGLISDMDDIIGLLADFNRNKSEAVEGRELLKSLRALAHYWMDYLMELEDGLVESLEPVQLLDLLGAVKESVESDRKVEVNLGQPLEAYPKLHRSAEKIQIWIRGERV